MSPPFRTPAMLGATKRDREAAARCLGAYDVVYVRRWIEDGKVWVGRFEAKLGQLHAIATTIATARAQGYEAGRQDKEKA